jgi:UDP-galactopyranose mutase
VNDKNLLKKYVEYANSLNNISFAGRLGTFSYLDMDKCIDKAIDLSDRIILNLKKK